MKKSIAIISISILTLLATGCANRAERLKEQGFSELYIQGDEDGCYSGISAAKGFMSSNRKDMALFEKHKEYQSSWSDAFKRCMEKEKEASHKRQLENNLKEKRRLTNRSVNSRY